MKPDKLIVEYIRMPRSQQEDFDEMYKALGALRRVAAKMEKQDTRTQPRSRSKENKEMKKAADKSWMDLTIKG